MQQGASGVVYSSPSERSGDNSTCGDASVAADYGAGHVVGVVGGEVREEFGDVVGLGGPTMADVGLDEFEIDFVGEHNAFDEVRRHSGGRDGIDAQRLFDVFHRKAAGELHDRAFAHGIRNVVGHSHESRVGGDVHDVAVALQEMRNRGLRHVDRTVHVHRHEPQILLIRHFGEVRHEHDARDIAQYVESTKALHAVRDRAFASGLISHVCDDTNDGTVAQGHGFFDTGRVRVDSVYPRAFGLQSQCSRASDAGTGSGDERNLAGKAL